MRGAGMDKSKGESENESESKEETRSAEEERGGKRTTRTRPTGITHGEANSIVRRGSHARGRALYDVNITKWVQTLPNRCARKTEVYT